MAEKRRAMVVVQDNGDISVYDYKGQYVQTADVRPMSFGGTGFDGLLSALQHAINSIPEHREFIYRFRGSDPGSPQDIERRRVKALYEQANKKAARNRARYAPQQSTKSAPTATDVDFSDLGI